MSSTISAPYIDDELRLLTGSEIVLTPAQQRAADDLLTGMAAGNVCLLRGASGMGKTTVLRRVQAQSGGIFITARRFMSVLRERSPAAIEETFTEILEEALASAEVVLVDDLHLVTEVAQNFENPRTNLINAALSTVLAEAELRHKKFVFSTTRDDEPAPVSNRALRWEIEDLEPEDFACFCRRYIGDSMKRLDFEKIHRFAPALNLYQLKNACLWLGLRHAEPTTEACIEYLGSHNIGSNVHVAEVEDVSWKDLKGVDDLIEELEAKVALQDNRGLTRYLLTMLDG